MSRTVKKLDVVTRRGLEASSKTLGTKIEPINLFSKAFEIVSISLKQTQENLKALSAKCVQLIFSE